MGRRPIGGIFSVGLEEPYRWKDSVQSEPEIRLWVAEGTANGMRPWVTKFSGVLYDRRWLPIVERIYDWHFAHERYLRNEAPLARVALLYSEQTADVPPRRRRRAIAHEDHMLGMYHALVEAACRSSWCTRRSSRRIGSIAFKLLILADARRAVRRAVRARFAATSSAAAACSRRSPSSLYDERPAARATSASPTCSACRSPAASTGPMQNSYLSLDADPRPGARHADPRRARRHAAHHQRRVPRRRAADAATFRRR